MGVWRDNWFFFRPSGPAGESEDDFWGLFMRGWGSKIDKSFEGKDSHL